MCSIYLKYINVSALLIVGVMAHMIFQAQRWRQEDQEVKISLNYVVSSRLTSLKYKEKNVFCNQ